MTSRRAPRGLPATQQGWVYTLHLVPAYGHAKHYTGWTADLPSRLAAHAAGGADAARLLQVQLDAGGTWVLVGLERGTRDRETQLKERGASRRCPACKAEKDGPLPPGFLAEGLDVAGLAFPAANPLAAGAAPAAGAPGRGRRRVPVRSGGLTQAVPPSRRVLFPLSQLPF